MWDFPRRDPHVQVILLKDIRNWSPGISENILQEETPYPLPTSCPMDVLLKLPIQHFVVELMA